MSGDIHEINTNVTQEYVTMFEQRVAESRFPTCEPTVFYDACEAETVKETTPNTNIAKRLETQIKLLVEAPETVYHYRKKNIDIHTVEPHIKSFFDTVPIWWHIVSMHTGSKYHVNSVKQQANNVITASSENAMNEISVFHELVKQAITDLDVQSYDNSDTIETGSVSISKCVEYWCLAAVYHRRFVGVPIHK